VQDVPRVVAVLVTHGGAPDLPDAVAALAAQTHPRLEPVAVDNASTDGTRVRLAELLGPDRVVVADTDLGFAGGVALAMDALAARDAREGVDPAEADRDLVLLLHDDLVLAPDAVERLVAALEGDPRVAIVGPKLRWAEPPDRLQAVGATIDLTGRVDDGLDPDERDQGQHDERSRVLFVGTPGMLVRRRVLAELGGFDVRTHAFREDLDLCWRAALVGHDVEVVPAAVASHGALGAEHLRAGSIAELGPRFLAERNTLAALLVNYGAPRLAVVLPLAVVVGVAKTLGFLLARRLGDARDTLAAWAWNVVHLPGTLRRRRRVQRGRRRTDAELTPLFGRVTPRLRAYVEALADRLAGDVPLPGEDAPAAAPRGDDGTDGRPGLLRRLVTGAPTRAVGLPTALLLLVGLRGAVIPGGVLRGGDLVPLPAGDGLIVRHLASWHDTGMTLSPLDPSPVQLVVGLLQALLPGPDGLVLRVLLLLPVLLAWVLALRASAGVTRRPAVRVALASLYVASPPALAVVRTGDLQGLAVLVLAPLLVVLLRTVLDPAAGVVAVWRRLATAAVAATVLFAAVPALAPLVPLLALAGIGHALVAVPRGRWRRTLAVRSLLLGLLPVALLGPWLAALPDVLVGLTAAGSAVRGGHPLAWLALVPGGADPVATGPVALASGVALLLAAGLGAVLRVTVAPRSTVALVLVVVGAPTLAWVLDRVAWDLRPSILLLPAAGAALLLAGAATTLLPGVLRDHPFGWRQLAASGVGAVLALTAAAGLVRHALDGAPELARDPVVPAYVATLGPVAPARVLVLGATPGGVFWEVVPAAGPDLSALGTRHDPVAAALVAAAVEDVLAGTDPRAAGRLGRLGVGAVVVPAGRDSADLDAALRAQVDLDPLPSLEGRVARVVGAVPIAGVATALTSTDRVPDPTTPPRAVAAALARDAGGALRGPSGPGGDLLVAVPARSGVEVLVDGTPRPLLNDDGLVRVAGVPADAEVEVRLPERRDRRTWLVVQGFVLLAVVSVGARPPRVAVRAAERRRAAEAGAAAADGAAGTDGADGVAEVAG
jgi:GT2 family glycosyltransferase